MLAGVVLIEVSVGCMVAGLGWVFESPEDVGEVNSLKSLTPGGDVIVLARGSFLGMLIEVTD